MTGGVVSLRGWLGTPVVLLPLQLLAHAVSPFPLEAQQLAGGEIASSAPPVHAASYDGVFDELLGLRPVPDRVAEISNLTLQRDVARFTLQSRQL